jgi:hypothetical protein
MNNKTKPYKAIHAVKETPKVKTLDMTLSITNHDLGIEVRRAFELAKSAGQELNLSFSNGTC